MTKSIVLSTLLAATLLSACQQKVSDSNVLEEQITMTQVQQYIKEDRKTTLLIDSRPPSAYVEGHIPRAVNMSITQIPPANPNGEAVTDPRLLKYDTLVVYGANPGSVNSMALAKRLLEAGYKDVKYFADGFDAWKAAGLPVETGTPVDIRLR